MSNLREAIKNTFSTRKVAIIGDLVADQFLNGKISRVSREAPVFILRHEATVTLPGAAANAAANVASLGGMPMLIGLHGNDQNGDHLTETLRQNGVDCAGVVSDSALTTTTKVRVLAGQHYAARQQVIRIDYENPAAIPKQAEQKLRTNLARIADSVDAIIISDYGYGCVFSEIFDDAKAIAEKRGIPLIVDSRYRLENFVGATAATPNREEVEHIAGKNCGANDYFKLRARLGCEALLVTNGNQGMTLFENAEKALHLDAVGSPEPVDVTGAGDTVIAAFALGLASGLSFADAALVANHAGGIVVMKKGTATATAAELLASIDSDHAALTSKQSN